MPAEPGGHGVLDLGTRQAPAVDPTGCQHRRSLDLGWIVALVGHAHERIGQAQGADDLGGAGKEGDTASVPPRDEHPLDNALTNLDQEITRQKPESGRAQTFRPASRVGPGQGTAPEWFSQVPKKIVGLPLSRD